MAASRGIKVAYRDALRTAAAGGGGPVVVEVVVVVEEEEVDVDVEDLSLLLPPPLLPSVVEGPRRRDWNTKSMVVSTTSYEKHRAVEKVYISYYGMYLCMSRGEQ